MDITQETGANRHSQVSPPDASLPKVIRRVGYEYDMYSYGVLIGTRETYEQAAAELHRLVPLPDAPPAWG